MSTDPSARAPSRVARVLCLAACLVCVALIGLAILDQLRPGNQDDKTLLFATSALGPRNLGALWEVRAALPTILAACPTPDVHACRERTTTRVASLPNYTALAAAIRLARWTVDDPATPLCERVALAYYRGILLLHGAVLVLLVALVVADRSPRATFSILALLMALAAAIPVALPLLPAPHPAHAIGSYAPRGALALVFLLQAAAFASGRWRVWIGLALLAPLVHAAEALLFGAVFVAALALRVTLFAEQRAWYAKLLAFVLALELLGVLAAWSVAGPAAAPHALDLGAAVRALGGRDLVWLAAAAAALALARRHAAPIEPLLLLAAWLVVACLVNAVGAALGADPQSASGQVFVRFYSGSSFVPGMLPWLAATLVATALWNRVVARTPVATVTVAALVVLGVASAVALEQRSALAAAVERAASNVASARDDLCVLTRCERECTFQGFAHMRPANETIFNLKLFDYLDGWTARHDAGAQR